MIVSTTSEMQKHLISFNLKQERVDEARFASFLQRAQEWVTEHIIGEDIEEILEIDLPPGQTNPHQKLNDLTGRVISELAYLTSIPESDLQRSESGFVVQSNEKVSPASQQRVDRLIQSLNERLNSDCDSLVNYLLNHSKENEPYDDWRGTQQFAFLTDAFIPTMAVMRQYAGQNTVQRWQGFYDLQPKLAMAMRTTVANYISIDEVETLLDLYRDDEMLDVHRKALRWIRMSVLAEVSCNTHDADRFALEARTLMLKHESDFPDFVASDRYELPKPFDFGDGTVANGL